MVKRILLVAGLLSFFPASAWAAGCGCGTINAMITSAKSSTIQAVNAYTAAEAQAIRSEILLAAQNIVGTMKTEAATIVRAIVALKESNTAALKGQAVAGQAVRTEDMYGKGAQPAGLCGASSVGAGLQLGTKAGQELHQNMREKQLAHADDPKAKPIEHLNRLLDKEHPSGVEMLESLILEPDNMDKDITLYYPLLMVKDFGSTEYTVSHEFMTNADVPSLAVQDLIPEPVNPFTGKALTTREKTAHPQYISLSHAIQISENGGTTYPACGWALVSGNIWDPEAWTYFEDPQVVSDYSLHG